MKLASRRFPFIFLSILLLVISGYFTWQKYKYKIVGNTVSNTVARETDSLYTIKYDSLFFDEVTGKASIKNIRIIPDTSRAKKLSLENMPAILLDVTIRSLMVKGVKTVNALAGKELVGDSVIIDHPEIIMYSLKPLQKGTKIEMEANTIYKQLLGKLDLIKVGFVFINNVDVKGVDFYSKEKNFDFTNGKFLLQDVLVDSAHHLDTNRILFCKQATFTVDSFFSYNHNRMELSVKGVSFLGTEKLLLFDSISLNRFKNDSSKGTRLLVAKTLRLGGVNTNEIIKNKNMAIDTIVCENIIMYESPFKKLKSTKTVKREYNDSTGFRNVYSLAMKHLRFPKVTFTSFAESDFSVGNISVKVNGVKADKIIDIETHPADYSKEVEVALDKLSMKSKDGLYDFNLKDITLNSLQRELRINSFNIIPYAGEKQFAAKSHFQRDRYDIKLSGISLKDIEMNNLVNKKLLASELVIDNTIAKIYRDLHKPLKQKSKIGNYPSQLLASLDIPVNITNAIFTKAYVEYRENETVSDSIGVVSFSNSKLNISNITNIPEAIQKNNELNIKFDTKALEQIPLKGNFKFLLNNSEQGNFIVNGHTAAFDALKLNKVAVPMALIKVNTGKINSIDFNFTGNNTSAKGDFTMKYENLKVDVLKRDKETKKVKKRGLVSIAANLVVINNNPGARGLRKVTPVYERNIYKSFFNLVWKAIFSGMKETVGIP